jgi:gluconolactonase
VGGGGGGNGMAVDAAGRLYITRNPGVQILSLEGDYLGLNPTPRSPLSLTFSGPEKRTLYVDTHGAVGPDGKVYEVPEGQRNMGMTLYKTPVLAEGFEGRAK